MEKGQGGAHRIQPVRSKFWTLQIWHFQQSHKLGPHCTIGHPTQNRLFVPLVEKRNQHYTGEVTRELPGGQTTHYPVVQSGFQPTQ